MSYFGIRYWAEKMYEQGLPVEIAIEAAREAQRGARRWEHMIRSGFYVVQLPHGES